MKRSVLCIAVLVFAVWISGTASAECKGDLDGNGYVDTADMNILLMHLFTCGLDHFPNNCYWAEADFDNSGAVDTTDMNILLFHLFINGDSDNGYRSPCMP